jgi:leucyl-tRNA synthetase
MSKSRGNVVNPDDTVREYGPDALLVLVMRFMPNGVAGAVSMWRWLATRALYRIE